MTAPPDSTRANPEPPVDAIDLARTALARARAHARTSGRHHNRAPGAQAWSGGTRSWRVAVDPDDEIRSGPGPDGRDPQLMGAAIAALISARGWQDEVSIAAVIGRWAEIVGPDVAEHVVVESFTPGQGGDRADGADDADGADLVVRADSTAWATQMRLLLPALRRRLEEELGRGVISSVRILGPSAPSWRKGAFRVAGRGPRDTYG
jgi:predicted nucleic acid-binding Zn ribbon protein